MTPNHLLFTQVAGAVALSLGLAIWTGRFTGLVAIHVIAGCAAVAGLWWLAFTIWRRGRRRLAVAAWAWGLAVVGLGVAQTHVLRGELHWIVQVVHLALGVGVLALAAIATRQSRPEGVV